MSGHHFFKDRFSRFLCCAAVLVMAAQCAGAGEAAMRCRDRAGKPLVLNRPDPALGYAPAPGVEALVEKKIDGKVIYDVQYTIDAFGRRVTPSANAGGRDRYLLFFGCSLTFGEGVADAETLPFYVGAAAPRYAPYNYGFSGYGPQQMLERLRSIRPGAEIREKEGKLVYLFIDDHVHRAAGMRVVMEWGADMPCYVIDRGGRLVRRGSFATARPARTAVYRFINSHGLLRTLFGKIDLPPRAGEDDVRLTAKIIEESRDLYRAKFHSDDFLVVLYAADQYTRRLIPYLARAHVRYLVCPFPHYPLNECILSEHDRHPTPKIYRYLADRIVSDLRLNVPER